MGKDILARVNNCEAKYCKTMKLGLFKEALNHTQNNFVYERERERERDQNMKVREKNNCLGGKMNCNLMDFRKKKSLYINILWLLEVKRGRN